MVSPFAHRRRPAAVRVALRLRQRPLIAVERRSPHALLEAVDVVAVRAVLLRRVIDLLGLMPRLLWRLLRGGRGRGRPVVLRNNDPSGRICNLTEVWGEKHDMCVCFTWSNST